MTGPKVKLVVTCNGCDKLRCETGTTGLVDLYMFTCGETGDWVHQTMYADSVLNTPETCPYRAEKIREAVGK